MLKFSTYMGYDITIDDNNGNGVIAKAEHQYKDILIKSRYFVRILYSVCLVHTHACG